MNPSHPLAVLNERAERDQKLLDRNQRLGDDLAKPRLVQFEFVADTAADAVELSEFLNRLSYGDSVASDSPDQSVMSDNPGQWRVILRARMPLSSGHLARTSGLMALLASQLGLHYDGWGCFLQTR